MRAEMGMDNTIHGQARRMSAGWLAFAAIIAASSASLASEPMNNSIPPNGPFVTIQGDMEVLSTQGVLGGPDSFRQISTTTDVDYIFLVCAPTRTVSRVRLLGLTSDIDLKVLSAQADHAVLGSSAGAGSSDESVSLAAG